MSVDEDLCSLRWDAESEVAEIIDQTRLPHELLWVSLETLQDYCTAIQDMWVRGAPLIGVTAAYGLACDLARDPSDTNLSEAHNTLLATRPTAVNLRWALLQIADTVRGLPVEQRAAAALQQAHTLCHDDVDHCARIGDNGLELLNALPNDGVLNIMTHCNAGWLAAVRWGTALAPIYKAVTEGRNVHVWVSETRPRNQGMNLTAWELQRAGIPCTVVADNSCGSLMASGRVDCVIVGSDRTASNGDVCNKVGTYLKALAANAHGVPFFVALPESTIDWSCASGLDIPIEERSEREVLWMTGVDEGGAMHSIRLSAEGSEAYNPAFDVTPATLVSRLVTDYGNFEASDSGLAPLREQVHGKP
ncbi:MAG: S-methyl-5-thioribose-1-phosphate isomerase [Pseudomonadota bacterium]